jgi:mannose-6-phosphate isomerase-like protein (cupin superfamily)
MTTSRSPLIVLPAEGELLDGGGHRYRFLATREVTDGRYGLWEAILPPGGGPPPHLQTREEEGFYVLEGEVVFYVNDRRVVGGPGTFVNIPVRCPHWFRNESDRPARMLVLVAPGGMEGLFKETGRPVTDPAAPIAPPGADDPGPMAAASLKYGIEITAAPGGHG